MEEGRRVTLIGAKLVKEGEEFIFLGASVDCGDCKLKNTCTNLELGRRYRIEKVRDGMRHDCQIHEDGVCVVEVIEAPITAALEAAYAFKNSNIVFNHIDCDESNCELSESCQPAGLKAGDRCTIIEVIGNAQAECKKGRGLKLVRIHKKGK